VTADAAFRQTPGIASAFAWRNQPWTNLTDDWLKAAEVGLRCTGIVWRALSSTDSTIPGLSQLLLARIRSLPLSLPVPVPPKEISVPRQALLPYDAFCPPLKYTLPEAGSLEERRQNRLLVELVTQLEYWAGSHVAVDGEAAVEYRYHYRILEGLARVLGRTFVVLRHKEMLDPVGVRAGRKLTTDTRLDSTEGIEDVPLLRAEAKRTTDEANSETRPGALSKLVYLTYAGFCDASVGPDMRPVMVLMQNNIANVLVLEPENRMALVRAGSKHEWKPGQPVPGGPFHLIPVATAINNQTGSSWYFLQFWALYAAAVEWSMREIDKISTPLDASIYAPRSFRGALSDSKRAPDGADHTASGVGGDTCLKWVAPGYQARHEIAALAAVSHLPGAVKLVAPPFFDPEQNRVGLLMENVDPYPLEKLRDADSIAALMTQLLELLASLASLGISHLDLKPVHLRIGKAGQLVLIDWGGACLKASSTDHDFCGTKGWRAPELSGIRGYLASPAADVYSAGLVLGWLLGRLPLFKDLCPRSCEAFACKQPPAFEVLLAEAGTADQRTQLGRLILLLPRMLQSDVASRSPAAELLPLLASPSAADGVVKPNQPEDASSSVAAGSSPEGERSSKRPRPFASTEAVAPTVAEQAV
jgi:hypothetical protein